MKDVFAKYVSSYFFELIRNSYYSLTVFYLQGPNLVDRNAVILRKGELVKTTYGRKQKEVFVAILNKDLIYCKKVIIATQVL